MGYLLYDQDESRLSVYFKVFEVLCVLTGIQMAVQEVRPGSGLAYSKFASESTGAAREVRSKVGMLILYTTPALVASGFLVDTLLLRATTPGSGVGTLKVELLSAALCVHFWKRVSEALFLHRYSGNMGLSVAGMIASSYTILVSIMNLAQRQFEHLTSPTVDLTWVGVVVFFMGALGNLYHHNLLRNLRKEGDKKYKIPEGGLFGVFVAPHYLFEILTFIGLSVISQTLISVAMVTSILLYLGSRSYNTKQWYLKKIDGFPKDRCVLLPGVF